MYDVGALEVVFEFWDEGGEGRKDGGGEDRVR